MRRVLVLGGGPDAEREVSLASAAEVASALRAHGGFEVVERTIDRLTGPDLRALPGNVVFPVLHGGFGEGGPLQDLLVADGRPFVGSGPTGARFAMDKTATKIAAARLGVPTPQAMVVDRRDDVCPLPLPVVVKPVHDGSSVMLFVCRTMSQWREAWAAARGDSAGRSFMVERMIDGDEITVGLLDGEPLPIIRITAACGVYDYEAKYHRDDTRYEVGAAIAPETARRATDWAVRLVREMGVRHVARVDFMVDRGGTPWLLEVNTMPGFTTHSLVPMAAAATGLPMPALCARLIELAIRDHAAAQSA